MKNNVRVILLPRNDAVNTLKCSRIFQMLPSHAAATPINKRDDPPLKTRDGTIIRPDTLGVGIYFMVNSSVIFSTLTLCAFLANFIIEYICF